jgi:large subunit ribosomal protein L31
MKANIHPTYHTNVPVTCSCGNAFTTGSTVQVIDTEICSNCHPFYTGKQKLLDTARRVEKFNEKSAAMSAKAGTTLGKKAKAEKRASQKAAKKAQAMPTELNEA